MRRFARSAISLVLAAAALWGLAAGADAENAGEAARALLPVALLRFERGDFFPAEPLTFSAALALHELPLLLDNAPLRAEDMSPPPESTEKPAPLTEQPPSGTTAPGLPALPPLAGADNGVPSTTLRPSDSAGYLVYRDVYIHNTSDAELTEDELGFDFSARMAEDAPQVLIVHTHGCEAYSMPPGEEYAASDDHRTLDESKNVLRVGDEIAQVLETAGIGVLHDRTLHDYPSYSGAYNRSLETVQQYFARYPSLVYVLDVHRDAVADADGNQYKLLCAEEPAAAQMEFVIGSDGGGLEHGRWRENLKLACAVQSTLLRDHPTLMRPIIVRNSRYNQQVSTGALLLEVGTAGNSLDEALTAARLFARGFAETVLS